MRFARLAIVRRGDGKLAIGGLTEQRARFVQADDRVPGLADQPVGPVAIRSFRQDGRDVINVVVLRVPPLFDDKFKVSAQLPPDAVWIGRSPAVGLIKTVQIALLLGQTQRKERIRFVPQFLLAFVGIPALPLPVVAHLGNQDLPRQGGSLAPGVPVAAIRRGAFTTSCKTPDAFIYQLLPAKRRRPRRPEISSSTLPSR
jgi:hypothetical protein